MPELNGWAGKILKVDLTSGEVKKIPTSEYQPEKFIGGVGLSTKIFWDMGCPKVKALDPANPLIVSVGPLTGLPGPFNRAEICGKGPQNYPEELFTYSGFGGKFPSELKYAGYDAIVVVGKAEHPVYLSIKDDEVRIEDAQNLWGLDLYEIQIRLIEIEPKASVLAIGPAGENLSRMSVVATETSATAGQGGFGALMGSKNLKAIMVRGTGNVKIARPDDFKDLISLCQSKGFWTEGGAQVWARRPLSAPKVAEEMVTKYRKKFAGPYGCPYQCYGFYDVPKVGKGAALCMSWWYGFPSEKPDTEAVWESLHMSQKLGLNHTECWVIISLAMETIKKGLLTLENWEEALMAPFPKWLGGTATDSEFLSGMLESIAQGKSIFSDGGLRGMHKIMEKAHDKKGLKQVIEMKYPAWGYAQHYYGLLGLTLHVALDTRDSGNSTDGYLAFNRDNKRRLPMDLLGKHFGVPYGKKNIAHAPGSEHEANWEDSEIQTAWVINEHCLKNSLPMCNFASLPDCYFDPPDLDVQIVMARALSAVTGHDFDPAGLWQAGERIWNLNRAVKVKGEDRTRDKDTFEEGFLNMEFTETHANSLDGGYMDFQIYIDKEKFEALKDRYYKLAGWDNDNGWPTRQKLEELDLKDVADELEQLRKLG